MAVDFPIDGKIGIDLTAVYASTSAGSLSTMPARPGDRVHTTNGGVYQFARCASDTAQYNAVIFSNYGDSASLTPTVSFVPVTTTNAAALGWNEIGFCQNSVASSYYTWVAMNGSNIRCTLLIGCNPKVLLYTTATAGSLDDTTVSAGVIVGVVANTSATSASAPYVTANWPHVAVNGAG